MTPKAMELQEIIKGKKYINVFAPHFADRDVMPIGITLSGEWLKIRSEDCVAYIAIDKIISVSYKEVKDDV